MGRAGKKRAKGKKEGGGVGGGGRREGASGHLFTFWNLSQTNLRVHGFLEPDALTIVLLEKTLVACGKMHIPEYDSKRCVNPRAYGEDRASVVCFQD